MCKTRILFLAMALLLLCSLGGAQEVSAEQPTLRRETQPYNIHPGVDEERFRQLIAEDGLKLKRASFTLDITTADYWREAARCQEALRAIGVELQGADDQLPEGGADKLFSTMDDFMVLRYSLSPDGKKVLVTGPFPFLVNLETQSMKAIVPATDMTADYAQRHYLALNRQLEEAAAIWSADGDWIALSFPNGALLSKQSGLNILLMDLVKGEARVLDPALVSDASLQHSASSAIPLRAAFDPVKPVLYYETYRSNAAGEPELELRSYDLSSREIQFLQSTDDSSMIADPVLWMTENGILRAFSAVQRDGEQGIVCYGLDGSKSALVTDLHQPAQAAIRGVRVLSFADGQGIVSTIRESLHTYQLFRMGEEADKVYGQALMISPERPAGERLRSVDLREYFDADAQATNFSSLHEPEHDAAVLLPKSAALSPDGRYLLLAAGSEETVFYVLDIERWVLGRVQVEPSQMDDSRRFATDSYGRFEHMVPGLRWLDNNRILIHGSHQSLLYELDFAH